MARWVLIAGLLLLAGNLYVGDLVAAERSGKAGNGRNYTLGLGISAISDDNLYITSSDEERDLLIEYAPSFDYSLNRGGHNYSFSYLGQLGYHQDNKDDDYEDHTLKGAGKFQFRGNARLELGIDLISGHDGRGTAGSEARPFVSDDPDVYDRRQFSALVGYGRSDTLLGVDIYATAYDKEYRNNRTETLERDHDSATLGTVFYFRATGKSRWLLEYRQLAVDYDAATFAIKLDSDEKSLLAGFTWDLTGLTTGTAKIGRTDKDFDGNVATDQDTTSLEARLDWTPRTQDRLYLDIFRGFRETDGVGDAVQTERTLLGWNHSWNSRLVTDVTYVHLEEEFDPTPRWDRTDWLTLSASYHFRKSIDLIFETTHTFRDSHRPLIDYQRAIYSLTVQLNM